MIHVVRTCGTGQIGFEVKIEHIIGAVFSGAAVDADQAFQLVRLMREQRFS